MAETITEKATCGKCGVDVRDGTTFCYNCGSRVAEFPETAGDQVNGHAAIPKPDSSEPVEPVKVDEDNADKLSRAAEQRRKSRVGLRKTKEYAWEVTDDSRTLLLAALVIAVFAFVVVFLTVLWK